MNHPTPNFPGIRQLRITDTVYCIMLDTARIPRAVPIRPDRAALKAVLVRVRMLVVIRAGKLAVSSSRFDQVIIFDRTSLKDSVQGFARCLSVVAGG